MPILDVDKARTVMVIKRGMSPGFAGIDNPLYYLDQTLMLFGDARSFVGAIVRELSGDGELIGRRADVHRTPESESRRDSTLVNGRATMLIIDSHAHIYGDDDRLYPPIAKPFRPPEGTGTVSHLQRERKGGGGPPRPRGPDDHVLWLGQPLPGRCGPGQPRLDGRHLHARPGRPAQPGLARTVRARPQHSRAPELPGRRRAGSITPGSSGSGRRHVGWASSSACA